MIAFDQIPKEKPANNYTTAKEGKQTATIFKAEVIEGKVDKDTGEKKQDYLRVSFKLDGGGFANDNFFDNDKPFNLYKIGRLIEACGLKLKGEVSLKDLTKLIANKKVIVDVVVNDRGYGEIDYAKDKDGIYPADVETKAKDTEVEDTTDDEVQAEIDAEYADEDF